MEEPSSLRLTRKRQRASIACQNCNIKRIKCNAATTGQPCTNCQRVALDCRLIESRRGKRKGHGNDDSSTQETNKRHLTQDDDSQARDPVIWGPAALEHTADSDDLNLAPVVSRHHGLRVDDNTSNDPNPDPRENAADNANHVQAGEIPINDRPNGTFASREGSSMPFENSDEADRFGQDSRTLDDQVADPRGSFNLTSLLQSIHNRRQNTLKSGGTLQQRPLLETADPGGSDAVYKDRELLEIKHAFEVPKSHVCLALFQVFFEHVAPHYPVIDRRSFIFEYAIPQRPESWLLLQAVLFMAAGHCEEDLLIEAGFKSRRDARATFFRRARALYDADFEDNKVATVQAVFLMSFWWPTPNDSKDTWHWLGIAISLATTLGIHRSHKDFNMPLRQQRLWKKIWWSLYTEDKHAAAALGRPMRIRLSDCDVEALEMSDFEGEPVGFGEKFHVGSSRVQSAYPISLTCLAKVRERFMDKQSQSRSTQNGSPELFEAMLQIWETGLADFVDLDHVKSDETIWPSMLRIAVCWVRILTHREQLPGQSSIPTPNSVNKNAKMAANQMVKVVEDLLATNRIQHCPVHIIPAMFAAMTLFTVEKRAGGKIAGQLASLKINTFIIALRELEGAWPISGWMISHFSRIVNETSTVGQI